MPVADMRLKSESFSPSTVATDQIASAQSARTKSSETQTDIGLSTSDLGQTIAWRHSTFVIALASSLLLFAALPPLHWWPLAWVAPLPWLYLIARRDLLGWRPHIALYLAGFAFWMSTLHWLRLPHWATNFGWVALSAYLAVYVWLFVALSRVAVHRLGLSIVLAAPLVWTGLDVARGYVLGGFTMSSLAHTQYQWLTWIQLSDVIGCYGLAGMMMLAAASLARMLPWAGQRTALWPLIPLVAAVAIPVLYGQQRLAHEPFAPGPKVALIQGSIDTTFDDDPGRSNRVMKEYVGLTDAALNSRRMPEGGHDVDLVVWPESMFRYPLLTYDEDYREPEDAEWTKEKAVENTRAALARLARWTGTTILVGLSREHLSNQRNQRWNSSVFVDRDGAVLSHYDKMHLVMFGEYVPLFDLWPSLYELTPMGEGLSWGEQPVSQAISTANESGSSRFSPSICYETVIPHLIRRHVRELRDAGNEPDVLVNVTNDGWFWGSSELDLHLICGVFRAVECRKPLVIAANTGFSAYIDGDGRIVQQGPRRQTGYIVADVGLDGRESIWLDWGGCLELLYVAPCAALALVGSYSRWRSRRTL